MTPANPESVIPNLQLDAPWRERLFPNNEWALLLVIFVECSVFSLTGSNFLSTANAFEITRLSVEVGLLSLVLTPIIITAGIDLSVGSMMGLAAVVLGSLWRDAHMPIILAAAVTLVVGIAGGSLNALMIARLRFPPLIVTLGTFSLFRGIAEGLTGGIENYSGFSSSFLSLGQGYVGGLVPAQLFILIAAIAGCAWWLHRTTYGRSLYAIGFSAEGARYAGIPVGRRLWLVYMFSGLSSSLAAVIYVAHIGQAKSDAGTGYELMAITAVVLGGASIFGGRGTVLGTVLGLLAIVVLQNGLRLSGQPAELGRGPGAEGAAAPASNGGHRPVIAMMPKAKGDPYFISCRKGAEEAAAELGVDLLWDGPTDLDPAKQNEVAESWITRGVDAIAVSVENEVAISTVLRKARTKGIT